LSPKLCVENPKRVLNASRVHFAKARTTALAQLVLRHKRDLPEGWSMTIASSRRDGRKARNVRRRTEDYGSVISWPAVNGAMFLLCVEMCMRVSEQHR